MVRLQLPIGSTFETCVDTNDRRYDLTEIEDKLPLTLDEGSSLGQRTANIGKIVLSFDNPYLTDAAQRFRN